MQVVIRCSIRLRLLWPDAYHSPVSLPSPKFYSIVIIVTVIIIQTENFGTDFPKNMNNTHIVVSADRENSLEYLLGRPARIHFQKFYNVLTHYIRCKVTLNIRLNIIYSCIYHYNVCIYTRADSKASIRLYMNKNEFAELMLGAISMWAVGREEKFTSP